MQLNINSMALGIIFGTVLLLVLSNHTGDLIKNAAANAAFLAPTLLVEVAVLGTEVL
jgi:hypothetical protein